MKWGGSGEGLGKAAHFCQHCFIKGLCSACTGSLALFLSFFSSLTLHLSVPPTQAPSLSGLFFISGTEKWGFI